MKTFLIKTTFIIFIFISFFSVNSSCQIAWKWVKSFGGFDDQIASDLVLDSVGNIYITGSFWHTATFGSEIFSANPNYGFGGFVVKIDSIGNLIWANQINDKNEDKYGNAISIDKEQNIYVTGSKIDNIYSNGISYLNKYSQDGVLQWSKNFDTEYWDDNKHKTIDVLNNVICVSAKNLTYTFDTSGNLLSSFGLDFNCIADDDVEYFYAAKDNQIIILDTALKAYNTLSVDFKNLKINALIVKDDSIYITGFFTNSVGGAYQMLVAKLNTKGEIAWLRTVEGEEYSGAQGNDILIDKNNNICVTGYYDGIVHFDSITLDASGFGSEVFLAKYNEMTGDIEQLIHGGGGDSDIGNCMALDSDNNIIVAGMVSQPLGVSINFGDIMVPHPRESGINIFVAYVFKSTFKSTISGQVTLNAEPKQSYIKLYRKKEDSTFELLNITLTDILGNYQFTVYKKGSYLVKTGNYTEVSTYYNQTYLWYLANQINLTADTTINNINIEILQCIPLVGVDSISGTISSSDSTLKSFIDVLLVTTEDQLISYTSTDSLGFYYFANLPKGQYKILVDSAGELMDSYYVINNSLKSASVSFDGKYFNNCDYVFGSDHKIYKKNLTFIERSNFNSNSLVVYPNPASTYIELDGEIANSYLTIKIYDLNGICLFESKQKPPISKIDITFLKNGMYYLNLDYYNGKKQIIKFYKMK